MKTLRILTAVIGLFLTSTTLTSAQDLIIALPAPDTVLPPVPQPVVPPVIAPSSDPILGISCDSPSLGRCDVNGCDVGGCAVNGEPRRAAATVRALAAKVASIPLKAIQHLAPHDHASTRVAVTSYLAGHTVRLRNRASSTWRRAKASAASCRLCR